jgi:hypothetical protein
MRYQRFHVQNFKGVKELHVQLDKQPSSNVFTLVGLNESGKSTILQAIHWFFEPQVYNAYDLIPKNSRANFNGEISVECDIELSQADDEELTKELARLGFKKSQPVERITVERKFIYKDSTRTTEENLWIIQLVGRAKSQRKEGELSASNPIWKAAVSYIRQQMFPPIIYYENFLFDFPDKIYLEQSSTAANPYRDVIQDVLNSLGQGLTIQQHLIARHNSGKRNDLDTVQAVLDEASAAITDVVITAWRHIVKKIDTQLTISLGSGIEEDSKGLYLQLKVKEGRQTFYIRERSLGFRWFFSFILFTHFRTYRDNQRENALFLLDEPASNLHPAAQTKLLAAFPTLPNRQIVIYSTHSHHMIQPLWLGGAFVVKNTGHDYSGLDLSYNATKTEITATRYFQYVASYPNDTDFFRPILDALDYVPGPLELVPSIAIVEGKNDYYALRYMNEIVLGQPTPPLAVYPSTGKDKTDFIVSLYLAWGRPFVVLLDADKGGRETATRLVREFGEAIRERVFTLSDIDSQWRDLEMEDLFAKEDRLSFVHHVFPTENAIIKSKLNTGLQAAFVTGVQLSISAEARRNFKRVIRFLTEKIE